MTLVFYISGHGFGHASRDVEVINAIAERRPDARIVVRTTVPPWFIEASALAPIDLQPVEVDTGVVQIDSLHLDEDETALRAAWFYADFDRRVNEEASVLRGLHASVVVGDVPPLAFAAAHASGVPSVALGNFTWDWIYSGYPQFERLAPGVIALIRAAYATATRSLRLPFHGGFEPMMGITRDIPLVARIARSAPSATRRTLGLDEGKPIVLASFGGFGLRLPYENIARDERLTLVLTDYETGPDTTAHSRLKRFTSSELAGQGLRYGDLVAASDVVVTKPGYGIVSECVANGTALLYTTRGRFAEQDVFIAEMPQVLRCRYIPQEDLLAGRWSDHVTELLRQPRPGGRLATNGATEAADEIVSLAQR